MIDETRILSALGRGDPQPASQRLPLAYYELRQLGAQKLGNERPGQTLESTALVQEAYLPLVGGGGTNTGTAAATSSPPPPRPCAASSSRAPAAKAAASAAASPGSTSAPPSRLPCRQVREDLLALDEALSRLAAADPQADRLVELRYFGGLPVAEAARSLGVSPRAADRLWAFARAWPLRDMGGGVPGRPTS